MCYLRDLFANEHSVWFSVRVRALGSFLSGIVAITSGNILGVSICT